MSHINSIGGHNIMVSFASRSRKKAFHAFRPVPMAMAFCFFMLLILSISPLRAENEFHVSSEFSYTYNDVSGPGKDQSSLTEGFRYHNLSSFYGNGNIKDIEYNFNVGIKATDDRSDDIKTFSLTNLQGRAANKIQTLTLGDTFESFSQYSLNTALKGGSYKYFNQEKNSPELTFVYGYAYPRWDNFHPLYGGADVRAIRRQVFGGRIKQNFTPDFYVGISFAESSDKENTRVFDTDQIFRNKQYTIDAEYRPIPGLTLRTELSASLTRESPQEGAPDKDYAGNAYKFEAIGDGGPSRVALEYERVSPKFNTLVGSATSDREKAKGKWRYRHTKNMTYNFGFLWYRDNLHGNRTAGRTDTFKPDIGVTISNLFKREYSILDIAYNYNRQYNAQQSTVDNVVSLNYKDRFGIFDSDTSLGYSLYNTKRNQRKDEEFLYNTALSSRHSFDTFILRPSLYLGGRTFQDELNSETDKIYEYSLGVGVDIPACNITSNIKAGQNYLEKGGDGDSSSKTFVNLNVYYRPKFLSKLNQGMIFVRVFVNDFGYSTTTRNFRENSITSGLNIEF